MKKPSIYSDRYKNGKGPKIKKYIYTLTIILIIISIFFLPYLTSKIREYRLNKGFNKNEVIKDKIEEVKIPGDTTPKRTVAGGNTYFEYKLTTGENIKVIYKIEEGKVVYLGVEDESKKVSYDISPNRNMLLINEIGPQTIILFDKEKTPKNHTMETFDYAGNGQMNRSYYSTKPSFIWCKDAKFLNDSTIVFISNVSLQISPQYIWANDIKTNKFKLLEETRAGEIKILDKAIDGIKITMDGVENIIDKDLKITGE